MPEAVEVAVEVEEPLTEPVGVAGDVERLELAQEGQEAGGWRRGGVARAQKVVGRDLQGGQAWQHVHVQEAGRFQV